MGYKSHTVDTLLTFAQETVLFPVSLGREAKTLSSQVKKKSCQRAFVTLDVVELRLPDVSPSLDHHAITV